MNKFHEILTDQLSRESSFINDNGDLKKFVIIDAAYNINSRLIELLIEVDEIKNKFFTEIKNHWVFNINLFVKYMENKNFLKDSYTRYKNKIGLNINGKFLNQRNEVSLVWPFKDCVLEGGQTKEDQKRPEIFFNELLAQEEIDQLFEPKVLTNWKRYTIDGEEKVTKLKTDKKGNINENLIIKGNNLLALHSLLARFKGKIQTIYIDPPYNTGNDSFGYNDNFNHSTWLTFMKNRLSIARDLLPENGSIYISIDQNEIGHLQVLMDEIFGLQNRAGLITIKRGSVTGHKSINPGVVNVSENLLLYCKNKNFWKPNRIFLKRDRNIRYNNFILNRNEDIGQWSFCTLLDAFSKHIGIDKNKLKKKLGNEFENKIYKFVKNNASSVIQIAYPDINKVSKEVKEKILESKKNHDKIYHIARENEPDFFLINGQRLLFYSDRLMEIDGETVTGEPMSDIWLDVLPNDLHNEGGVKLKKGKKPEKLVKRILEIEKKQNLIFLDFHIGSGTSVAVAHKMGIQYIGIEQLDYGKNDSTIRMQNVIGKKIKKDGEWIDTIDFDKSGISKAVNWQGGGDFIYCELKKYNQTFIEQIEDAKDNKELLKIWDEMKEHSFINYNVDIKKQDEEIEKFKNLTLKQQKEILLQILNKNQLYVNLSSIDDKDFKVSVEDKKLTKEFYQTEENQNSTQTETGI